jgi:GNAT superfamily N-acetyltransferase
VSSAFVIRRALAADAAVVARHRASMFRDMGQLAPELYAPLVEDTVRYLQEALATGEYVGWLAASPDNPAIIVAGAGVQQRRILPRPIVSEDTTRLAHGREAIVLNVYTEPAWRNRGLAGLLMEQVLDWARSSRIDTLVLHASAEGRRLYERLGFVQTNEMRFRGSLSRDP